MIRAPARNQFQSRLRRKARNRGRIRIAENSAVSDGLKPILTRACAAYLLHERRGAQAADRVEHFHLSNGARLERINWLGNPSEDGLAQSAGLMVNYLYRLQDIEKNHESYTVKGKIAASGAVQRLTRL